MISPSNYLSQWAREWGVRETIERQTGLTPRLRLDLGAVLLEKDGKPSSAAAAVSDDCRADLVYLVEVLDRVAIGE